MSDSTGQNNVQAVAELPSYTDLGNRTQIESMVHLNAPPTQPAPQAQQVQPNQVAFSQSVPVGNPYGHLTGYPTRPVYYKPATHQPVNFQYNQPPPQYQPQPQFAPSVQPGGWGVARDAMIKESYPVGYVVFHNVFLILLSLAMITVQTLLIFNNAEASFVGGGCWAGAWLLFTAIFSLSSVGCKSNCTIVSSVVFQLLGLTFACIGCVILSSVTLSGYMPCWDFSDYCDKVLVWQLSYTLVALGFVVMVLCLVFSIFILVRLVRARRQFDAMMNTQHVVYYNQQQMAQQQSVYNPNYNWNQSPRYNNRPQRLV